MLSLWGWVLCLCSLQPDGMGWVLPSELGLSVYN